MEKLFEHTLQKQNRELQEAVATIEARSAEQTVQINRLTAMFEKQLTFVAGGVQMNNVAQAITGPITGPVMGSITTTTVNNTINVVTISPWDGDKRINVTAAQIVAAFAENARLKAYALLEEHQLTDPEIAPPYVTELLMDLTKRAHADPTARNVYLNPKRADQALVHMASGKWEVMPLTDATRLIFDGVAKAMVRVTMSNEERRQLPLEAQNALAMAGLLYDDEPEEYAKRAKAPMAAHLTNCRDSPQLGQ